MVVARHRTLSIGVARVIAKTAGWAGWEKETATMARYVALMDGEAGAYGVTVPDLPGCTSGGSTTLT